MENRELLNYFSCLSLDRQSNVTVTSFVPFVYFVVNSFCRYASSCISPLDQFQKLAVAVQ